MYVCQAIYSRALAVMEAQTMTSRLPPPPVAAALEAKSTGKPQDAKPEDEDAAEVTLDAHIASVCVVVHAPTSVHRCFFEKTISKKTLNFGGPRGLGHW